MPAPVNISRGSQKKKLAANGKPFAAVILPPNVDRASCGCLPPFEAISTHMGAICSHCGRNVTLPDV